MEAESIHVPVLPQEILHWLDPQPGQCIVDGTLGGGGHTLLLADRVGVSGQVLALDRDGLAVRRAEQSLPNPPVIPLNASYHRIDRVLEHLGRGPVNGILLDLGLSSDQLADDQRGFSFQNDGPLDLRFDIETGQPAAQLLQRLTEKEIADIIYQYGEERFSRRIARRIVQLREEKRPVRTSGQLADLVRRCVPRSKNHNIDPATRTFQALRIAVNEELQILQQALAGAPDWLLPGGRIAIISFHSLEDRIVKNAFRDDSRWQILTKKPVVPTESETLSNSRARSAKLRVAAKLEPSS